MPRRPEKGEPAGNLAAGSPIGAMWPHPGALRLTWLPGAEGDYLMLPSRSNPRLMLPVSARGADRMLVRFAGSRRTRLVRRGLRAAARWRLLRWLPGPRLRVTRAPDGIEAHLADVFGQQVNLGVLLGPPRANLKPVVQVFDEAGGVLGFAKVGFTPSTTSLLEAEATALGRLAERPVAGLAVPRVLGHSRWHGADVLVQTPMSLAQTGLQPRSLPAEQLAALAISQGVTSGRLASSDFWARVRETGRDTWEGVDVSSLAGLRDAIDPECVVTFGAWHGDFAPWNAAIDSDRLEVWDWERFEDDVPVGLDGAHWRAQLSLAAGVGPGQSWPAMLSDVEQVVRLAHARPAVDVTAAAYILAIWSRYRSAGPTHAAALRPRVTWLCGLADVARTHLREER